ncbi:hypothetical protein CAC01_15935 [Streptomyces sp. CLI2509]|nr:hypothetical protein CAC01_15935 [Streptomyces sp. CLI2509]
MCWLPFEGWSAPGEAEAAVSLGGYGEGPAEGSAGPGSGGRYGAYGGRGPQVVRLTRRSVRAPGAALGPYA